MSEHAPLRRVTRPRLYEQVAQQILDWVRENDLEVGDRLPPERELAGRLGVSRATVSQALVAMEVVGVVTVRHGDGAVLMDSAGTSKVVEALRRHAQRLPDDHRGPRGPRDQAGRAWPPYAAPTPTWPASTPRWP